MRVLDGDEADQGISLTLDISLQLKFIRARQAHSNGGSGFRKQQAVISKSSSPRPVLSVFAFPDANPAFLDRQTYAPWQSQRCREGLQTS